MSKLRFIFEYFYRRIPETKTQYKHKQRAKVWINVSRFSSSSASPGSLSSSLWDVSDFSASWGCSSRLLEANKRSFAIWACADARAACVQLQHVVRPCHWGESEWSCTSQNKTLDLLSRAAVMIRDLQLGLYRGKRAGGFVVIGCITPLTPPPGCKWYWLRSVCVFRCPINHYPSCLLRLQLTGVLDDCFCDVESIDVFNNFKIYPRIKKLTERDYFRYYKVRVHTHTLNIPLRKNIVPF